MIEHDMSLVLNICDPIHVLDFGRPLMVGSPAEVRSSELVRDAYLGKAVVA
jgi:ABC-type branched-subunit amino acid transport system ATPase component